MLESNDISADVVIVGAGIVGLSQAVSLADSGLHIVVINQTDGVKTITLDDSFAVRVSAISAASSRFLKRYGVWDELLRKQAYVAMHVWDKDNFGRIEFTANEIQQPDLGHIVENNVLELGLRETLKSHANVSIIDRVSFTALEQSTESVTLSLDDGRKLICRLLIGADGANSQVRGALGINLVFQDYEQTATVANVRCEKPHENIARQAFTRYGPLAFLPLPDPCSVSIVWSQQNHRAAQIGRLDEAQFCRELMVDIDGALGVCELISARYQFPLRMRYAKRWLQSNAVLIGDAAHTIHPLAGQGANLGLSDVALLTELILHAIHEKVPINRYSLLRKYERARKAHAVKTIATMEAFKRGFSNDDPVLRTLRGIALNSVNHIGIAKRFFMQQASGN